ncbi:MAG: HEAT repeat domain-containing protein [Asgard group archaeon]|nr:HEAT repeat domain-containing protein [Asgard group archaeon]
MTEKLTKKEKERIGYLIEILKNEQSPGEMRQGAAMLIGMLGGNIDEHDEAIKLIISSLKADDWKLRQASAWTLGRLGKEAERKWNITQKLLDALYDHKKEVKIAVIKSLGELRIKKRAIIIELKSLLINMADKQIMFEVALSLAYLEGTKESKGFNVLQERKRAGKLNKKQILRFNDLRKELENELKAESARENAQTASEIIHELPESSSKERLELIITSLKDQISNLNRIITELGKNPRLSAEELNDFAKFFKIRKENQSEENWWKRWSGEIFATIIGAVIGGGISAIIQWLL